MTGPFLLITAVATDAVKIIVRMEASVCPEKALEQMLSVIDVCVSLDIPDQIAPRLCLHALKIRA